MKLAILFLLALALGCGPRRPSVVLITLDTTRADKLGCYGGRPDVAPHVDQLASGGVRFARAFSPYPLTAPAHSSILTGLYPNRHGVRDNGIFRLDASVTTLAEVLRDHGYATAAFISAFVLERQFGLDQGFEVYDGLPEQAGAGPGGTIEERRGADTTASFLAWLDHARAPFFAWIHYYDPHFPYDPHEPFKSRFAGREYEGEIAAADAEVGRVLDALQHNGLRDDTIVVITADHGEGLGEHGEMTHGYFLYNTTTWVPLVMSGPGLPRAASVTATVSHVDLAPTLLDLLHVEDATARDGASLLPVIAGAARDEPVYLESELPRINWGFNPMRGICQGGFKYVTGGEEELFAPDDPGEHTNLIAVQRERAMPLAKRIEQYEARSGAAGTGVQLNSNQTALLTKLGYVGGSNSQSVSKKTYRHDELVAIINLRDEGKSKMMIGRLDEAEQAFRRLVELSPQSYTGYELLGTVLAAKAQRQDTPPAEQQRLFQEAQQYLEKAIRIVPDLKDSHFNLAVAAHYLGDDAKARAELETVIRIDPTNTSAKSLLARMKAGGR